MYVDRQTLGDLEILHGRHGAPPLASVLDRTRTPAGRRRLRERLTHPLSDPSLIASELAAVRYALETGLDLRIPEGIPEAVESYLHASLASAGDRSLLGGWIEAGWVAVRYPELLTLAREGVVAVSGLVQALEAPTRAACEDSAPAELRRIGGNIAALVQKLDLRGLVGLRGAASLLAADHRLRSRHRGDMLRLLERVGELDVCLAAARLADEGWAIPELDPGPELRVEGTGIRHPLLSSAVGNGVELGADRSVVFLTGPNMAGKTTYLRSVALCVYLAHCGLPVPADTFRLAPVDALFTSFAPEDNLREGLSFFMGEVRRVRTVLERISNGDRILALFDEVFRGTNVHDALEASRMVIEGCARARGSGFLFSSHLAELAPLLEEPRTVRFAHFHGESEGGRTTFDYRLRPGVSDQRLGLDILRQEGIDRLLHDLDHDDSSPITRP